jgi:hypothetical protein
MRALGKRKAIPHATGQNCRLWCLMASQHIVLMDNDIPRLYEEWMVKITDLVSGIPLELLPLHEVNHEKINIVFIYFNMLNMCVLQVNSELNISECL